MMLFKRKQIVVLSLVLLIVIAGYMQYSHNKSVESMAGKDSDKIGEAVYVNGEDVVSQEDTSKDAKNSKDSKNPKSTPVPKATGASKQANDFFTQAKMDREITRGKDTDALKEITVDAVASKETKAEAHEKMMKIVESSEREMRIETLVSEKGFSDVVALFADDGSIDIIVKSPGLTNAQSAQITDIVSRHAKMDIDKIHIKNIF
jgi:stage III sporulation protein AH